MIVSMKKVLLFMKEYETDAALKALREAGLVHIMTPKRESPETEDISEELDQYQQAVSVLERNPAEHQNQQPYQGTPRDLVDHILDLDETLSDCHERIRELGRMERFYEQWGEFNPHTVRELAESGVQLYFCRVKPEDLPESAACIPLKKEKTHHQVLFVHRGDEEVELPAEAARIPDLSPEEIRQERRSTEEKIEAVHQQFITLSVHAEMLREEIRKLSSNLEFHEIKNGLEHEQPVRWLMGFVPKEDLEKITEAAQQYAWGMIIDDPDESEPVPTKLKNRRIVRIIEPVFEVLGTVPGYREYDISSLFLGFFTVFVAMIVSDAGYGLLFLVLTVLLHLREGRVSRLSGLLYLLSSVTVVWGALTGNWFGSETIASIPVIHRMIIPQIAAFPETVNIETAVTQQNVMYLCFIIGTVQLSIACLMNFKRDLPQLSTFSHLGWLSMIIGLYYLVLNLVLGFDMPVWPLYAIGIGFALVIIFSAQQPGRSFLKGLAFGFGGLFTTFLDSISTFSNIISYIRLFAVGMASVAISSSFNSMAEPMFGGVLIPAALLVLLIGHGMNIVMALLSVFVHGIRLNMLEFSGQLGMEWTGFKYAPFGEQKTTQDN